MSGKVLLVFPGLGKTYASKKTDKVLEIQLSMFQNINKRLYGDHFPEHLKGNTEVAMKLDPEFPENVLKSLAEGFSEGKIPVMALKSSNIEFLLQHKIDFEFVMPSGEKIEELRKQYLKRGNTPEYIQRNIDNIEKVYADILQYNKTIYFLREGEHLLDFIEGIEIEKDWLSDIVKFSIIKNFILSKMDIDKAIFLW